MVVTERARPGDQGNDWVDSVEHAVSTGATAAVPSFAAVYREQMTFVYASLLRLGVPRASVDDALQDVFFVVHRRLRGFEGRSSMRSWVFGIARRIAFRYRRTAQRADAKSRAFSDEARIDPAASDVFEREQRNDLLARALDELDDDKRVAITLHVFEEMSGPELAATLGVAVDTAYSRIKAARRDLKRALEQLDAHANEEQLVAQMREATLPDRPTRKRAAALVAARLGVDPMALGISTALVGWKGVVAAIVLGAAATLAAVGIPSAQERVSAPVSAIAAPPTAAREVDVAAAQVPAELAPVEVAAAAPAIAPPPEVVQPRAKPLQPADPDSPKISVADEALRAEVELVTKAKRALDDGDGSAALEHLAAHARDFSRGQLAVERDGYRAAALCIAGRTKQGRGEARVFLERHGTTSVAARVTKACAISR